MSKQEKKAVDPLTPPGTKAPAKGKTQETAEPSKDDKKEPAKEVTSKRSKFALMYPDASKITLLVTENPKKEGSKARERFQYYFEAPTVEKYLAAGGTYADVAYDVGHKFISVEVIADAPVAAASPAPAAE